MTTGSVPDRIVLGRIQTLDERDATGEAVLISSGRVVAIGGRADILRLRAPGTEVEDFGTAAIVPGFNDAHAHLDSFGLTELRPALGAPASVAELQARIAELVAITPAGEWIVTMPLGEAPHYFDQATFLSEGRLPTRWELDAVAPDHPVYISSPHGYWGEPPCYGILNSRGLAANGIDRDTRPRSASVDIARDASGEPTGVIVDRSPLQLSELDILTDVPRFTPSERREGLRRAMRLFAAKGTTSIYEGHGCAPDVVDGFRQLHEANELLVRTSLVVSPTWSTVAEAEAAMSDWLAFARGRGLGDDMLRISGIFVAFGGDPVVRELVNRRKRDLGWGASVRQVSTPEEFEQLCFAAARTGLRVHTLASDRLRDLVPILERISARYPLPGRRWVVEHISRAEAPDLDALGRLGVGVTLIPVHYLWKSGHKFAGLDEAQLDLLSPARFLVERGIPVAAGTDAVPNDPLFTMWSMMARRSRTSGRVMGEGGCLDARTALRLVTTAGAWFSFEEHRKGPLSPGYCADLAVLSADPTAVPTDAVREIACVATMVGGRWTHRSDGQVDG
ncbi:putative amidohydrolase YtcJ [Amorphus suaedae]